MKPNQNSFPKKSYNFDLSNSHFNSISASCTSARDDDLSPRLCSPLKSISPLSSPEFCSSEDLNIKGKRLVSLSVFQLDDSVKRMNMDQESDESKYQPMLLRLLYFLFYKVHMEDLKITIFESNKLAKVDFQKFFYVATNEQIPITP